MGKALFLLLKVEENMATIDELEQRVKELENELQYVKMVAVSASENHKITKWGFRFNLLQPRTLNGKILWLRENYWNYHPARYYINDKYFFKYYQQTMFGSDNLIPLLGVWDSAEDINFDFLPRKFVLKRSLGGRLRLSW